MKKLYVLLCIVVVASTFAGCMQDASELDVNDSPEPPVIVEEDPDISPDDENDVHEESAIVEDAPDTSSKETKEDIDDLADYNISGKYICANEYYKDEYFIDWPEGISSVTFFENGTCVFFINYNGGCEEVDGVYKKESNIINVDLDFEGTLFVDNDTAEKYLPVQYTFRIVSDDKLIIDKGFYGVRAGDPFVRSET